MDALINWSLRNRAAVIVLALAMCFWGSYTALRAPIDVFPDLTAPTVTVITETAGMSSTEVESLVTFPIESSLNGAPNIRRVRSSSAVGISIVNAEFDWDTDIYLARQIVSEKLRLIRDSLPSQSGEPILAPISSVMGEIYFIGLTTSSADNIEMRTIADTTLRRRLLSVPGVSQVTAIGGGARQYQIWLNPTRLETYGISVTQIADALAQANNNIPAGFINQGGSEYLVSGVGRFTSVDDIHKLTLETLDGVPVQIRDLGQVKIGARPSRGISAVQGQDAVLIGIQKQPDANTLELTAHLESVLDTFELQLPSDITLHRTLFRQADFIETALDNVLQVLLDGAWLVVLIIAIFLLNARASFITLTALPLSLLGAVLVLDALGGTINTMTLGGMAIAIGALVDDAVIDVENVLRRLRENASRPVDQQLPSLQVVREASIEIRSSIVFATLIIILVFVPLFFLSGIEGRLLQPLGLAYVSALAASLIVAVTVTPVLCSLLLPRAKNLAHAKDPRHLAWLKSTYSAALLPVLRRPALVVAPAVFALLIATLTTFQLGRSFLPEFNEGALTIAASTLPGTSLQQSGQLASLVDDILLNHPEVISVARRTGRAELDAHANGVEVSEYEVRLHMLQRSRDDFMDALRGDLSMVPGVVFTIGQPISHRIDEMLSGTRAAIAVKIFGNDLQELKRLANNAKDSMQSIEGVVDLSVEQQSAVPTLQVKLDRNAMGRLGVNSKEMSATLEAAVSGHKATELLEGSYAFDVTLRLDLESGDQIDALPRLPVLGEGVTPLGSIASITRNASPNKINHENLQRKLVVSCNVVGRDLVSVVEEIRSVVQPQFANLAGYRVEFGGQFESANAAQRRIGLLSIAIILCIAFLLRTAFKNLRDALLVMANLPLALIGGVAGVWLCDGILSVGSMIGFITVFGIATRNGILLVSHFQHLRLHEKSNDLHQAVVRGSRERLVPILMTAFASGLALVPLAMANGEPGSEIQAPMAWVILFGLLSSTVLNMFVVPALYLRFAK
ncbi:MAG: efflux RND transporter permease subunit [Planctomycetes bacterium]|nr:efflux RND transporter permease subunit [Planctomycetota bacterium]